jgi:hypothetical protein
MEKISTIKNRTKKEQILDFIKDRRWARTSDIIEFGTSIYYNRAERTARDLATEGFIRRATEEEKTRMGMGKMKQDVWLYVDKTQSV